MGIKVTTEDILTSDGKYPDRMLIATSDIIHQAELLAIDVTELLQHYGKRPPINSGYRTVETNEAAGGSKNSSHCQSRAVDFADPKGEFARWCLKSVGILSSLELYIEDPNATKGWVHVTNRPPKSGRIVFKP